MITLDSHNPLNFIYFYLFVWISSNDFKGVRVLRSWNVVRTPVACDHFTDLFSFCGCKRHFVPLTLSIRAEVRDVSRGGGAGEVCSLHNHCFPGCLSRTLNFHYLLPLSRLKICWCNFLQCTHWSRGKLFLMALLWKWLILLLLVWWSVGTGRCRGARGGGGGAVGSENSCQVCSSPVAPP